MKRTLIKDTVENVGKTVMVSGWVNARRDHGKIAFLDLRDRSGILQVVCTSEMIGEAKDEYFLEIEGLVKQRPERMINKNIVTGTVEMEATSIKVLSKAEVLPFNIRDLKTTLPTLLDFRPLTLRNEKIAAIFKIQEQITISFRRVLKEYGFTEFQSPAIVGTNAEGGAEVFPIKYYDYNAYLAQSPQFYKQILVGVFERVFTITKVYRAEPSVTTRHLSEYISMDAEMAIESWTDIIDMCQIIIKAICVDLEKECGKELMLLGAVVPKLGGEKGIPRIKMRDAQQIIFERTGRDNRKEPDLNPDDEKEICKWAEEKRGSELVFITHYPTKKRPFYTFADPEDPDYTLSFDILCRGLEITTGGQRINDYEKLLENIKKWGNDPKSFEFYLQAFKYGMPPEGGFAFGLERITKQILGLENLREASFFPRDMERIDQRLSVLQPKESFATKAIVGKEKKETKKSKIKKTKKPSSV